MGSYVVLVIPFFAIGACAGLSLSNISRFAKEEDGRPAIIFQVVMWAWFALPFMFGRLVCG